MEFTVPAGWGELTQEQLRKVLGLLAIFGEEPDGMLRAKMWALLYFCDVEIVRSTDAGWLCREKGRGQAFLLNDALLPGILEVLDWMERPEEMTVRIEQVDGCKAVDMWLRGVPFGLYLQLENYYQAFLQTQDGAQLGKMARILYQVPEGRVLPSDGHVPVAVLFWYMAVKRRLSGVFGHFLRPVGSGQDVGTQASQMEMMNAQIRLLTKGDVTKNARVLECDTWYALTELDALARESEEFKRKYGRKNV